MKRNKRPRLVKYQELLDKLLPIIGGWSWAEDSIRDLWLMGAPVPGDTCPGGKPCKAYPKCDHIRRILLPDQFAKWWQEVAMRQGKEFDAEKMLDQNFKDPRHFS